MLWPNEGRYMPKMKLPHLPATLLTYQNTGTPVYTATAMEAYGQQCAAAARKQALEEAAKVVARLGIWGPDERGNHGDNMPTREQCAAAIRALKDKEPPAC